MKKILYLLIMAVLIAACNPYGSEISKQLTGCWINENNGNWEYGFFEEFAICNNDNWNYKTVSDEEIVLHNKGAKPNANNNETISLKINILNDSSITVNGKKYFKLNYPHKEIKNYDDLINIAAYYCNKMSYFPDVKEDTTDFAPYVYNRYDSATINYYERNTAQGFESLQRRYESNNYSYQDIQKINNNGFIGCGAKNTDSTEHYGERYVFRVPVEGVSEIHNGNLLKEWYTHLYLPSIIEPNDTLTFFLSRETFNIFGFREEHYAMGNNQRFFLEQDLFFNYLVTQRVYYNYYNDYDEKSETEADSNLYNNLHKCFVQDTTLLAQFIAQSKMPLSKKFVHYNKNVTLYKFASKIVDCKEAGDFFKQNPQLFNEQEVILSFWGFTFVMKYIINQDSLLPASPENIKNNPDFILCKDDNGQRRLINPKAVKDLGFSDEFLDLFRYECFEIYKDDNDKYNSWIYNFTDDEIEHLFSTIKSEKYRKKMENIFAQTGNAIFADLIQDFKGKVLIINFWDTWCSPCCQAIKEMKTLEDEFEGKDVEFLFITDETSEMSKWEKIKNESKGRHYRWSIEKYKTLQNKILIQAVPTYIIVGKDGEIKDIHSGFRGNNYYREKIEEELKK